MSTESKIFTGVLASALTGLLVALHVIDPSQADTVSGMLETGLGLLISLVAIAYGLESLLVKHKNEVENTVYEEEPTTPPVTPTPVQPVIPTTPEGATV